MSSTMLRIATAFHGKTEGSVSARGWEGSRWGTTVQLQWKGHRAWDETTELHTYGAEEAMGEEYSKVT